MVYSQRQMRFSMMLLNNNLRVRDILTMKRHSTVLWLKSYSTQYYYSTTPSMFENTLKMAYREPTEIEKNINDTAKNSQDSLGRASRKFEGFSVNIAKSFQNYITGKTSDLNNYTYSEPYSSPNDDQTTPTQPDKTQDDDDDTNLQILKNCKSCEDKHNIK